MEALSTRTEGLDFSLKAKQGDPECWGRRARQVSCVSGRKLWWRCFDYREVKKVRLDAGNLDRKPLQYAGKAMRADGRTEGAAKRR